MADEASFDMNGSGLDDTRDSFIGVLNDAASSGTSFVPEETAGGKKKKKKTSKKKTTSTSIVPVEVPRTQYQTSADYKSTYQTTDDSVDSPEQNDSQNSGASQATSSTKKRRSKRRADFTGTTSTSRDPIGASLLASTLASSSNGKNQSSTTNASPGANTTQGGRTTGGNRSTDLLQRMGEIVVHLKNIDENVESMKEMMENAQGGKGKGITADSFASKGTNGGDNKNGLESFLEGLAGLGSALALATVAGGLLATRLGGVAATGLKSLQVLFKAVEETGKGMLGLPQKIAGTIGQSKQFLNKAIKFVGDSEVGQSFQKLVAPLQNRFTKMMVSPRRALQSAQSFAENAETTAKTIFGKLPQFAQNASKKFAGFGALATGVVGKRILGAAVRGANVIGVAKMAGYGMGAFNDFRAGRNFSALANVARVGGEAIEYGGIKSMLRQGVVGMAEFAHIPGAKNLGKWMDTKVGKKSLNAINSIAGGAIKGSPGGIFGAIAGVATQVVGAHVMNVGAQYLDGLDKYKPLQKLGIVDKKGFHIDKAFANAGRMKSLLEHNYRQNEKDHPVDDSFTAIGEGLNFVGGKIKGVLGLNHKPSDGMPEYMRRQASQTHLQASAVPTMSAQKTASATGSAARNTSSSGGAVHMGNASFSFNHPVIKSKDDAKQLIAQAFAAWQRMQASSNRASERFSNLGQANPQPIGFGFGVGVG